MNRGVVRLHSAYQSLRGVRDDLRLLLLDPDRFLFDAEMNQGIDNMQLLYRKEKLYGRDKEASLITDAFARVSRGKSEALFIDGFSGSGKTMLVNSLRAELILLIRHKFDSISQQSPFAGVISAFDQICQMIKDSDTPQRLAVIVNKLRDQFGVGFRLLVRLLRASVCFPPTSSVLIQGSKMETQ